MGFPGGSVVKNPPANGGDMRLIPGPGKILHAREQLSHSLFPLFPHLFAMKWLDKMDKDKELARIKER